jgi:hypothetical protein
MFLFNSDEQYIFSFERLGLVVHAISLMELQMLPILQGS